MSQEQLHRPEAASEDTKMFDEEPQQQQLKTVANDSKVSDAQPAMTIPSGVEEPRQQQPETVANDSKASNEHPASTIPSGDHEAQENKSPITYGDVFPAADEDIASEVITSEDASLMQTAEAMAFGHTMKGGAASAMQSAAAKNVQHGYIEKDAHSKVSEFGFGVSELSVPGATMDVEYVAGEPVFASAKPTPTDPSVASLDAVTIGEALEATAVGAGDSPVDEADARALESAERRATGSSTPMKGGIGATAQSAAQLNRKMEEGLQTTLADVLMDATSDLPLDKVVTYEDAYKVLEAELRGESIDDLRPGGVGATLVAAANINEQAGLIPPPDHPFTGGHQRIDLDEDKQEDEQDAAVADEWMKYHPLHSTQSEEIPKQTGSTEEKTPLVQKNDEQDAAVADEWMKNQPLDSTQSENVTKQTGSTEEKIPLVQNNNEQIPSHGTEKLPAPKQSEEEKQSQTFAN